MIQSAYTRVLVNDFTSCFLFYKDVMEFDVTVDDREAGYAEFKAGDMRLSLFKRQEMAQIVGNTHKPSHTECQDRIALIFTVTDLEEVYQKIRHKGVKFAVEPMNNPYYGIKTAYLRDPDGTLLGLFEMLL